MKGLHFAVVACMLVLTGGLLHKHGKTDMIPSSRPLADFPVGIGGWTGKDVSIPQEALDVLGAGDFMSRIYSEPQEASPIGLFIAYFPTQRTGVTIHSPKNCLPGGGWYFESSKYVDVLDLNGKPHQVGEYLISNGDAREFVIYWYLAHGRSVANEYTAKVHLVLDAIRMNRTDGALIRIMTPVQPGERTEAAKRRAEAFTSNVMPTLPQFVPD